MPTSKSPSLLWLFYVKLKVVLATITISSIFGNFTVVRAQIIPDRSLPNNSTVNTNNNTVEINGGTTRGTNLFHSFSQFSINPSNLGKGINTAYFNNSSHITHIFSRVTGNEVSVINGLIKNNSTADLFLINPNGIIFGENAALDLGGSFISSTAEAIQFADEREFRAINSPTNSLLTVSIPVGLQHGDRPSAIRILDGSNKFSLDSNNYFKNESHNRRSPTQEEFDSLGFKVAPDKTLALVGGNIFAVGGNITSSADNVELGSVGQNQTVGLNVRDLGWELDYESVDNFGQISLSEGALINSEGSIRLQGKTVRLTDSAKILIDTWGDRRKGKPGNLTINARKIELTSKGSGLFSVVRENAIGNGADINLHTQKLTIQDEAQITLDTLGLGNGGNLNINAAEINLTNNSFIFARGMTNMGNRGDIAIATDSLSLEDGGKIYSGNFGDTISNSFTSNLLKPLEISNNSLDYTIIGTGEVGNIEIDAQEITLNSAEENISSIATATFSRGGGIIKLNADTITLNNTSQIFTETRGESHGGGIYLQADSLHLNQGGSIDSHAYGGGNPGKIAIDTKKTSIVDGVIPQISKKNRRSGHINVAEVKNNFLQFIISTPPQLINVERNFINLNQHSLLGMNIDTHAESPIQFSHKVINNSTDKYLDFANTVIGKIASLKLNHFIDKDKFKTSKNTSDFFLDKCSLSPKTFKNNSVVEAQSWVVNYRKKIELLPPACL